MKKYKIISSVLLAATMLISNGCADLLNEKPQSGLVPTVFGTPLGLLGGISGAYNQMRTAWGTEGFTLQQMAGTDETLAGGSVGGSLPFFTYNGLTSANTSGGFALYTSINTLNGVLEIAPTVAELDEATLKTYLGQAQFLRAFIYFHLLQTYGNIPLNTEFITVPTQEASPADPADVYAVIVQDLQDAITNLPNTPTAPFLGKAATVGAAKWLLAKVYLTRGWLLGDNNDFTLAYNTATDLITTRADYGLDLWQNYADAFLPANDYGKETIFVSDHINDPKYGSYTPGSGQAGGASINITPWMGLWNGPGNARVDATVTGGVLVGAGPVALNRDIQFGRPFIRVRPNMKPLTTGPNTGLSYIFDQAFVDRDIDSRYHKTFQTVWLANAAASGGGQFVNVGTYSGPSVTSTRGQLMAGQDTAYWYADYEVPGAPQAFGARPFKGIIVTPTLQNNNFYPYMKKYADPRRTFYNDPSYRPLVLARFSEVYLIAAEAAFKLGQMQNAADMLNVVRRRAAFRTNAAYAPGGAFGIAGAPPSTVNGDPYAPGFDQATAEAAMEVDPGDVTIDFILDERTREFYGEGMRWLDLVRTKQLVNRVLAWNPTEAGTTLDASDDPDHFMLRPIPLDQINLTTVGPPYPQNEGY
ncbi:MAG TPA: RagB/SusD family nutrient uptake outer membrane protein [Ohtaekwangia sp.]